MRSRKEEIKDDYDKCFSINYEIDEDYDKSFSINYTEHLTDKHEPIHKRFKDD